MWVTLSIEAFVKLTAAVPAGQSETQFAESPDLRIMLDLAGRHREIAPRLGCRRPFAPLRRWKRRRRRAARSHRRWQAPSRCHARANSAGGRIAAGPVGGRPRGCRARCPRRRGTACRSAAGADGDAAAGRRVLQAHCRPDCSTGRRAARDRQGWAPAARRRPGRCRPAGRDRRIWRRTSPTMAFKIDRLVLGGNVRVRVGARQRQQLIGRVRQLPYAFLQGQQTVLDRLRRGFGGQQIQLRLHAGDGRAQLMRRVGDELLLRLHRGAQHRRTSDSA